MSFESLIEKAVAKTGEPIKLKRRNAQPEAIEQAKLIVLGLCALSLLFLLMSCANQPSICPEIKVSFCPVK